MQGNVDMTELRTVNNTIYYGDDEEIYVAAHLCVCFEEGGSSHSYYSDEEILDAVGADKLAKLKVENRLFWSVFGKTIEGLGFALEDYDNSAVAKKRVDELNAEFVKNEPTSKLPADLQALFDAGEIAAGNEKAFLHYYNSFKVKAESAYAYGAMADENLDGVARAFNSLPPEVLADVREIGREARLEVTRLGEKDGLESRGNGFGF